MTVAVYLVIALAGLCAQIVDGGLGMGFGVTSTSMLILIAGLAPAQASAVVHAVQLGTSAASGWSHYHFGNVNWKVVLCLGVPGAVGALMGSLLLSKLSLKAASPITASLLILIGMNLVWRFSLRRIVFPRGVVPRVGPAAALRSTALETADSEPAVSESGSSKSVALPWRKLGLYGLGFAGGFVSSTGGGGWGPVVTSTLLTLSHKEPRKVIGTVNAAEFLVTLAVTVGFMIGMWPEILRNAGYILVLLVGGIIGAPLGAWLVTKINPTVLGGLVGTVIVVTNLSRVSNSPAIIWVQCAVGVLGVLLSIYAAHRAVSYAGRKPQMYSTPPTSLPVATPL